MFEMLGIRLDTTKSKYVRYYGLPLCVPKWVQYLTTDSYGRVKGHEVKPTVDRNFDRDWHNRYGETNTLAIIDFKGDWRESLTELPIEEEN
jgi:hypothetical protein